MARFVSAVRAGGSSSAIGRSSSLSQLACVLRIDLSGEPCTHPGGPA